MRDKGFKILGLICMLMILVCSLAYAEPPVTLFENFSSANNAGTLKRGEAKDHAVFCNYTNVGGSTTALIVNFDGSIDGDNFKTVASKTFSATELTDRTAMFFVIDYPVAGVMGNISSVTDSGKTYVDCKYKAHRTPNR